jgi:hypothetical protein
MQFGILLCLKVPQPQQNSVRINVELRFIIVIDCNIVNYGQYGNLNQPVYREGDV